MPSQSLPDRAGQVDVGRRNQIKPKPALAPEEYPVADKQPAEHEPNARAPAADDRRQRPRFDDRFRIDFDQEKIIARFGPVNDRPIPEPLLTKRNG